MYQTMMRCIRLYRIEVMRTKKSSLLPHDLWERQGIPPELRVNAAKISVSAGCRALVENHRGVLEYSGERIVISAGRGRISVMGASLLIEAMNSNELLISGRIQSVEWE